ncbi:hypothetical protein ACFSTD_10490 [Novosphingobium colocasiae]
MRRTWTCSRISMVVVQRAELLGAVDPVPSQRVYYWQSSIDNLLARKRTRKVMLLDGDHELVPGVQLLSVPSHTEGMQVVVVSTEKGPGGDRLGPGRSLQVLVSRRCAGDQKSAAVPFGRLPHGQYP